jgi:hypothetical protein
MKLGSTNLAQRELDWRKPVVEVALLLLLEATEELEAAGQRGRRTRRCSAAV